MTNPTPAVSTAHPPDALLRVVNPSLRVLLRTPLAGPLRKQFMVLNFTGRKTGRQFSIPVSAHQLDGSLYAIANAGWKHNFRDGADAEVLHGGKTTSMRGEMIADPATVAELAHRLAQSYGAKRAQTMMGLTFRDGTVPSAADFREAAEREKIVAVRFTPLT
ncbi:hypothetical protein SAMN04489835_0368 [Mycolicibacterium rutilum]|uniref:Deazaflavin-dependent oxidoreductase, nitroreductase family n=1 Tax=Mycolicibacterium rutilum TaxID=370526 RepID=A0A1H6IM59_MYCRU|nr:hypothetical protein [Mycolicibacterium rutilum]SEH48535.1 hypothetical protein SAMN04489835_0368 [Mycolicibacterium rutilum]